jgi:hypothetical protein
MICPAGQNFDKKPAPSPRAGRGSLLQRLDFSGFCRSTWFGTMFAKTPGEAWRETMYKVMITGLFAAVFVFNSPHATRAGENGSLDLQIASPDQLVNSVLLPALEDRVAREAKTWHVGSWLNLVCHAPAGDEDYHECRHARTFLAQRVRNLMCCLVAWLPEEWLGRAGV